MLVVRVTQFILNYILLISTLRKHVAMLATLTPPAASQVFFVCNRSTKTSVTAVTIVGVAQFVLKNKAFISVGPKIAAICFLTYFPAVSNFLRRIRAGVSNRVTKLRNTIDFAAISHAKCVQINATINSVNAAVGSVLPSAQCCRNREAYTRTVASNPACTLVNILRI